MKLSKTKEKGGKRVNVPIFNFAFFALKTPLPSRFSQRLLNYFGYGAQAGKTIFRMLLI